MENKIFTMMVITQHRMSPALTRVSLGSHVGLQIQVSDWFGRGALPWPGGDFAVDGT